MWGWISGSNTGTKEPMVYPELSSPKTADEFEKLIASKMDKFLELINDPSFQQIPYDETDGQGIRLFDKTLDNSPVNCVRIEAHMDVPSQHVIAWLREENLEKLKIWDTDVKHHRIHQEIKPGLNLMYAAYFAPTAISEREFVTVKLYQDNPDGTFVTVSTSVNHDDFPKDSSYVRGVSHISGWHITPVGENATRVVRVVQIDVKGWIPTAVINMYKKKGGDSMKRFRDAVRKHGPPK